MNQFKLATSLFVSTTLLSTIAFAHDALNYKAMSAPGMTHYNWTGYYAGLNAGVVQHTMKITDNQAAIFNGTIEEISNPGPTIGFQTGYRRQMDSSSLSGVYGIEFSGNFANLSFNKEYGSGFASYQLNAKNELKDLFLLQLTGGIAADRTLLFLAAGLSYAYITGNVTNLNGTPFFDSFNVNRTTFGTAIGAGIEYAFNDKISARFKVDWINPSTYTTSDSLNNTYQVANSIVQGVVGINYKFA